MHKDQLTGVVILPAAISAGLEVLYNFDSPGFEAELVAEIYWAMLAAHEVCR